MNNPPLEGEVARDSATEGCRRSGCDAAIAAGTPLHHAFGAVPLPFQGRI